MALDMDSIRQTLRTGIEITAAAGSALAVTSIVARSANKSNGAQSGLDIAAIAQWFGQLSPEQRTKFLWCIFLDVGGAAPEILFPGPIGEGLDAFWAPVYAFLLFQTFGGQTFLFKTVLAVGGFFEEVLPFVSIVPSATIGVLLEVSADRAVKGTVSKLTKDKDAGTP